MDIKQINFSFYVKDDLGRIFIIRNSKNKLICPCDLFKKENYCFHIREVEKWKKVQKTL